MKTKVPYEKAIIVAEELVELLSPYCERIEIVGSLRRRKSLVGDVELLFISKVDKIPDGLFDWKDSNAIDEILLGLLAQNVLAKRPNEKGYFAWGEKNKFAIHVASEIAVDLFATTNANWFTSLVVRTGSKETNLRLTNGAIARGASLNAYGSGITFNDGRKIDAHSEQEVFALCGVNYLEPKDR